jgi:hypothetical protein
MPSYKIFGLPSTIGLTFNTKTKEHALPPNLWFHNLVMRSNSNQGYVFHLIDSSCSPIVLSLSQEVIPALRHSMVQVEVHTFRNYSPC